MIPARQASEQKAAESSKSTTDGNGWTRIPTLMSAEGLPTNPVVVANRIFPSRCIGVRPWFSLFLPQASGGVRTPSPTCRFMESLDLELWTRIGTMNQKRGKPDALQTLRESLER